MSYIHFFYRLFATSIHSIIDSVCNEMSILKTTQPMMEQLWMLVYTPFGLTGAQYIATPLILDCYFFEKQNISHRPKEQWSYSCGFSAITIQWK